MGILYSAKKNRLNIDACLKVQESICKWNEKIMKNEEKKWQTF